MKAPTRKYRRSWGKEPLLNITLKPSFLFIVAFILSFDEDHLSFYSLIASFLHEAAHISVLLLSSCPVSVELKLGGMAISAPLRKRKLEWLYLLSGPLCNIIIFLFLPKTPFGIVNLLVGAVNLLPIYFTDGGRLLSLFLALFLPDGIRRKTETAVSVVFLIPLFALGILTCFSAPYNFTLLIIVVYLIVSLISGKALD